MDRNEVAAMLGRRPNCRSVDRAMSIVAQGYDLAAVLEGGSDESLARAEREYLGAHLVLLAKGRTVFDDRIGVFYACGYVAPRLF